MTIFLAFCCGIIIMGIIADKTNKAQTEKLEEQIRQLREQIDADSKNYLVAVSTLESDAERLKNELALAKRGQNGSDGKEDN